MEQYRGTTIVSVRRGDSVAIAGDGQVSMGNTIMKGNARKVRTLAGGRVIAGFAGGTADAFTLFELFESKLEQYGNLTRAAIELAKDWRTDRRLRRLEALLCVADEENSFIVTGNGDVIEPENDLMAIGSGGPFAQAAALALLQNTDLDVERTRADGFIYVEDAARAALKELESSGALTTVEAETIHAQAFQAAQLDDHTTALYDSRGDTKSIAPTATAMEKVLDMLLKFDNGELTSDRMPLSYQQGNPVTFSGLSQSSTSTAEISGNSAGYSNSETFTSYGVRNGGRQAWRIPESGPEYANKLMIVFKDGHTVYVNDTSNNYRESDGFVFKPGMDDGGEGSNSTSTSHGGIFLHAPYGNNSQKATLFWS